MINKQKEELYQREIQYMAKYNKIFSTIKDLGDHTEEKNDSKKIESLGAKSSKVNSQGVDNLESETDPSLPKSETQKTKSSQTKKNKTVAVKKTRRKAAARRKKNRTIVLEMPEATYDKLEAVSNSIGKTPEELLMFHVLEYSGEQSPD